MADRHDLEGYGVPIAAIFAGGVAARNLAALGEMRPKQALEHADKLRKSGASADVIHAETSKILAGTPYAGVTYGRDGKARFEISDDGAAVRRAPLDKAGRGFVGDMLHHPELYRAYPEAQLLGVERANFRGGGFDGRTVHIGDNHFAAQKLAGRPVVRDSVRGVALHELQHYAQDAEGFAPGASPDDFERRFPGEKNRALREKLYETTAGEVEAENTRARRNMTAQQRRATAPRQTETGTVSEQHLGPDEGRARTGEVRRVQRMVEKSPPAGRKPRSTKSAKPIGDLGEKIGGARKDTAVKTGPRIKKAAVVDTDPRPAWQRRFVAVPELDRTTKQPSGLWSLVDKETNSKWGGKTLARGLASEKAVLDAIPLAAVSHAKIGNIVNKTGAIAMIAAPAAAAYVAYQGTRAPAVAADGTVKAGSRAEATANAAVAGGVVAGVGYGVMKVIGGAMKLAAKAAPKIAPALGPVGIGLGIAGMGYGAYQGYQRHGIKGAALGAIGADAVLDASKGAQPLPATAASQGRLSPQQKQQFETANAAYQAMKAEATAQPKSGWSDEARIAAYVERQKRAGSAASNAPYGGKPRKD